MRLRSLLIVAWLVLGAAPAWAAITWDTATANGNPTADTADSFTHTIGTGSNVYVGVCVTSNGTDGSGSIDVSSLTVNGSAATFRAASDTVSQGASVKTEYWDAVLGSTNGAVTVAVNVSANDRFRTTAFSLFGVDQTTPVGTAATTEVTSTSASVNVSSAVNELVMSCLGVNMTSSAWTVGAGQTERWLNSTDINTTAEQGSSEPGGATVTMSHSWTTVQYASLIAIPIKPASATVATPTLMLLGVGN